MGSSELVVVVRQELLLNGVAHGTLIAPMGVLAVGSRRSIPLRHELRLAAYALGVVTAWWVLDQRIDLPEFVLHSEGKAESVLESSLPVLNFCHPANQVCSRMWVVASALALVFWLYCPSLTKRGRLAQLGILGMLLGLLRGWWRFALGYLPMDIHGVLAFIGTQTIWSVAVGALLIRGSFEQSLAAPPGCRDRSARRHRQPALHECWPPAFAGRNRFLFP